MQRHQSVYIKRTARYMIGACGLLFSVFSLSYLIGLQSDVMSMTQHLLSKGSTTYSHTWGGIIITSLLLLLATLYKRTKIFPTHSQALYFFPSCIILGLITCVVPEEGWDVNIKVSWVYLSLCILIYLFATWVSLHFPNTRNGKQNLMPHLWTNILLMALQFCMIGSIGNCNDIYHYRLRTERLIMEGNDSTALSVGKMSQATDRNLSALRAFALSRRGELGEKLLEYPQEYGSNGLLPKPTDTISTYNWTKKLYRYLGGYPGRGITDAKQFLEILSQYDNARPATHDYLLCAYLLDKELDKFVTTLPTFYIMNDSLPVHYKEAIIIYTQEKGEVCNYFTDKSIEESINGYNNFARQFNDSIERSNKCRREYGHTYWWYYHFK